MNYPFNQSDKSLYSMLTDAFVGFFWNTGRISSKDLVPRTFASEPNGGVLTQSWLVLMKVFQDSSNIEMLRSNARDLEKSKELTESIAGHTLLWAIANHESVRRRKKKEPIILDDELLEILLK